MDGRPEEKTGTKDKLGETLMRRVRVLVTLVSIALCQVLNANDSVTDLRGMSIYGNKELPKSLVIVPWKDPVMGEIEGKPASVVMDDPLTPLDREVFQREINYYHAIHAESE